MRKVTTLQGALRRLARHCETYSDDIHRAIDSNDEEWLASSFRPRVKQILQDIAALATLAAEQPEVPPAVHDVLHASVKFMIGLCDKGAVPGMKSKLLQTLQTLAESP